MDIIPSAPVRVWGFPLEGFNAATLYNTWLVMLVILVAAVLATRYLRAVPGRLQAAFELLAEFFDGLCKSTLGDEYGRKFMPFITTLFLFVMVSNFVGIIPNFLVALGWPGFYCPTQDLNTPVGLALVVLFVVHISAIRIKGFRSWFWSFYEPSFPGGGTVMRALGVVLFAGGALLSYVFIRKYMGAFAGMAPAQRVALGLLLGLFVANAALLTTYGVKMGRVPNVLMAPLNFVGEIGKAISHPFRLFGNIFGGFVILVVAVNIVYQMGLPPILRGLLGSAVTAVIGTFLIFFFGLFIGLVHAFVFAMLALAYAAVQIRD